MTRSLLPPRLAVRLARRSPEEWFLGSLQTRVLATLAARGPSSVREISDELAGEALAYTTVMTVLGKLHEKRVVRRTRRGKGYLYEALYTADDLRNRMAKHLVRELVQDFGDVALVHFASALDAKDRRRLRSLRGSSRRWTG